jgi:toxin FitB
LAWIGVFVRSRFSSALTLGKLQSGVELTRQQDAAKASEIEIWLNEIGMSFACVPLDATCCREWARLMANKSAVLEIDAMIAATARAHGLTVATRNEKDFKLLGVEVVNPFKVS